MQRTIAWSLTAVVLGAVVALVLTVLLGRASSVAQPVPAALPTAPEQPAADPTPTAVASSPSTTAPSDDAEDDAEHAPAVTARSGRLADVQADQEPAPVSLDVTSIGVDDAPIDPVAVESDGGMEIPVDIRRVGWYEYGPTPGEDEGSAVLTAHIDSREQGKGVFYDLDGLGDGDTIDVTMDDGSVRSFEVFETRQIPKVDLPTGDLFRREGAPVLALITCGGEFDPSSRHYLDNIVVLASPTG